MTQYSEAQKQVMLASFEVGQAQRELEDAEKRFREALKKLDSLEGLAGLPPSPEWRPSMSIYVVYDHIRYEGCSPPLAAFSTRESASAFIDKKKAEDDDQWDKSWSIAELSVDTQS